MKAIGWLAKPGVQTWFNGIMTVIWLVMLPITLLFIGPFSTVLWVSFISAWALFATHLGAWIAALVNVKAARIDDRTEESLRFERIEAADEKRDSILAALLAAQVKHDAILAHLEAAATERRHIKAALEAKERQ